MSHSKSCLIRNLNAVDPWLGNVGAGLKILKSESGKTFGISNKSTLKIASPADNRWSSMHHFDMTPWRNKRSRLELLVKILVKALV